MILLRHLINNNNINLLILGTSKPDEVHLEGPEEAHLHPTLGASGGLRGRISSALVRPDRQDG